MHRRKTMKNAAATTIKYSIMIQNVHRTTHTHTHSHTRTKGLKIMPALKEKNTLRCKICTAPDAYAQNDWKCCWCHKKTARYDPKFAPRHRKTLDHSVRYAYRIFCSRESHYDYIFFLRVPWNLTITCLKWCACHEIQS